MDTDNQIQALDSKTMQSRLRDEGRILGPVRELKCGWLKNLSENNTF